MNKDDIKKTITVTGVFILIVLFSHLFSKSYGLKVEDLGEELDTNSEMVSILMSKINSNFVLRKAKTDSDSISDESLIKYTLLTLNEDEVKVKKIKPVKIVCAVNNRISFTSSKVCNVIVISNDLMKDKIQKNFNITKDLTYNDFVYNGYNCKNDGKNYYCMKNDYLDYSRGFSYVKSAYNNDEQVVIYEYFLMVNVGNFEMCRDYFDKTYCENYDKIDMPSIDDEVIKKKGTLYEHIFKKNGEDYYISSSKIITK